MISIWDKPIESKKKSKKTYHSVVYLFCGGLKFNIKSKLNPPKKEKKKTKKLQSDIAQVSSSYIGRISIGYECML